MAGKTIIMSKLKQVVRLRSNGIALQAIAKAVALSRNTVKKYLRLIEVKGLDSAELLAMDDEALEALLLDPGPSEQQRLETLVAMFPYFEKELKRVGVTRWVLWGEYRQQHPGGYSYSQVCDHFKTWKISRSGTMHFEHEPGDKLFIDFTGKKLPIVDPQTGEVTECEVFVAVLGYSQLTYVEAIASQRKEDFIMATEHALHFFGGVPRVIVPDNLKSAVTKASKYEAELNQSFWDFANHYGTSVLPARGYKPRDKSLVERAVSIAYSRIFAPLRNETFHTIIALNQAIKDKLLLHNQHAFQKDPQSRLQRFELEEKHLLAPLAEQRYEIKQFKMATVMINGHVQIFEDRHCYSVPYRFIGMKVKIIYSNSTVSIYHDHERIAYHKRSIKKHGYTTVKDHLSSEHKFVAQWCPDKFTSWALSIDSSVKDYIALVLDTTTYPEQAYRSCVGILSLEKKVGKDRLINAVKRATFFGVFSYTIIKKILDTKLDQINLEEELPPSKPLPKHGNVRGASTYQ